MYGIDPPTLVIVVSVLALCLAVVMVAMRAGFPRSVQGIEQWAAAIPLFVIATALFGQPDAHPVANILLANTIILMGVAGMTWGMLRFFERPVPRARNVVLAFALLLGTLSWHTFVQPSFHARLVLMSLVFVTLFARLSWLPLRYGQRSLGTIIASLAFGFTTVSCLLRVATVAVGVDTPARLLDFGTLQVIFLAAFNVSVLIGSLGFILMINERLRTILEFNASHDTLTGVLNRGAFFKVATKQFNQSRHHHEPLSIVLLDLDHFKLVNDRHGHAMGDRVLKDFCRALRSVLRPDDTLGRYGGEEFVILLPGTAREQAVRVAQRLRESIRPDSTLPRYTVSVGVTTLAPGVSNFDELMNGADKALYLAKKDGRDRIEEWWWEEGDHDDPFTMDLRHPEPATR